MRTLVTALLFGFLALPAGAADLGAAKTDDGAKTIIKLSGQIAEGDTDKLSVLLGKSAIAGEPVAGLWLNSPGGNIAEGLKLAALVHNIGMITVVAYDTSCASACFLPFAAGSAKYVSRSARVGVHSAINSSTGQEDVVAMAATVMMARAATTYGVPATITAEMVNAVPKTIAWLSEQDLVGMGVVMSGVSLNSNPTPSAPDLNYITRLTAPDPEPSQAQTPTSSPQWVSQAPHIHEALPAPPKPAGCMAMIRSNVDNNALFHRRILQAGEIWGPVKYMDKNIASGIVNYCGVEGFFLPFDSVVLLGCHADNEPSFNGSESKTYNMH